MVRVAERPQLSFQEYRLARFHGVQEEGRGVGHVRGQPVTQGGNVCEDLFDGEQRLPVEMLKEDILLRESLRKPSPHQRLVEELVYLQPDLQVLVGIEWRNS